MNIKNLIAFGSGLTVGSLITYFITKEKIKRKYADIADSEIKEMRSFFDEKRKSRGVCETRQEENNVPDTIAIKESLDICKENGYALDEDSGFEVVDLNKDLEGLPYLIEPDNFGELDHYEIQQATYYSDGVLVDDVTSQKLDIEDIIGLDSLNHFGDPDMGYDDFILYVRNPRYHLDIEVTISPEKSSDIVDWSSQR